MITSKWVFCLLACVSFLLPGITKVVAQSDSLARKKNDADVVFSESVNPGVSHHKPKLIAKLPAFLHETSGLLFADGGLWTINDGGNPAQLIKIDTTTGDILRMVVIGNAVNTDWESLCQDSSYVYIGDFGNNYGSRKDLQILKIFKSKLFSPANDTVPAEFIYYSYPDQADYTPALNTTNFDCEAFFYLNHSLHLFSKNWGDQYTKHYTIPAVAGRYKAELVEQFPADGLITDASVNKKGNVVLLGYKNSGGRFWKCFCWLIEDCTGDQFFSCKKTRIKLGSAFCLGQTEGIFFKDDNTAWLSSESIRAAGLYRPAKLFRMDLRKYF